MIALGRIRVSPLYVDVILGPSMVKSVSVLVVLTAALALMTVITQLLLWTKLLSQSNLFKTNTKGLELFVFLPRRAAYHNWYALLCLDFMVQPNDNRHDCTVLIYVCSFYGFFLPEGLTITGYASHGIWQGLLIVM